MIYESSGLIIAQYKKHCSGFRAPDAWLLRKKKKGYV